MTLNSTDIQLFILDAPWLASPIYFHSQRKRNPTWSLQPAWDTFGSEGCCSSLSSSWSVFSSPCKRAQQCQNSTAVWTRLQEPNQGIYGSWIWWNCLKLNIKRNIASETPRTPLHWKSLFMLVSQTCRNPPSMLICLPLAHSSQRRVQQKPVLTRPLQPAFGSEGFSCSLCSSWRVFSYQLQKCQAGCQQLTEVETCT